jgi:hypothetical protein
MIFYLMLLRAYETNKTVDSLMKQYKIFYIKYYLFHDAITIVKSTIFKLKSININIYFLKLFYNLNFKSIINQTH